jgi:NAD(P)-dependent dehydrogenase (short-subunit alcohol dehydrogenase family)
MGTGRLDGRRALVTGAASGIGRAITERFVADGASVVAVDIDEAGLAALSTHFGDAVVTATCDVTSEDSVASACAVADDLGGLDVVVANAGRGTYSPVVDHGVDEWRAILDLCLTGVFLTIKHAAPVTHDGGSIITIASLNATQPSAGMSAYCAAKAGVVMLTKVAAMELGARRIRVNSIAPGLVETNATSGFFAVPGVVPEFVENTTLGRFAQPDDIANVAAFLAGDGSGFVSGTSFAVDGGASTKRYPDLPAAFARLAVQSRQ